MVALISKCSESNGDAVQLGVVRALLTVTTAEHFVLHGDCLMQVRISPQFMLLHLQLVRAHNQEWDNSALACALHC